jgi:hypothetical protein
MPGGVRSGAVNRRATVEATVAVAGRAHSDSSWRRGREGDRSRTEARNRRRAFFAELRGCLVLVLTPETLHTTLPYSRVDCATRDTSPTRSGGSTGTCRVRGTGDEAPGRAISMANPHRCAALFSRYERCGKRHAHHRRHTRFRTSSSRTEVSISDDAPRRYSGSTASVFRITSSRFAAALHRD